MSLTDPKNDPSRICYESNNFEKKEQYIFNAPLAKSMVGCSDQRGGYGNRINVENELMGIGQRDDYFIRGERENTVKVESSANDYCGNKKLENQYTRTGLENRGQEFDRFIQMPFASNFQKMERDEALFLNSRDIARKEYEDKKKKKKN